MYCLENVSKWRNSVYTKMEMIFFFFLHNFGVRNFLKVIREMRFSFQARKKEIGPTRESRKRLI